MDTILSFFIGSIRPDLKILGMRGDVTMYVFNKTLHHKQDKTQSQLLSGKQNRTGLNSEFFFSYNVCFIKTKELCLPNYFPRS